MYSDTVREWLLDSSEPWTRYQVMVDLLEFSEDDPQVQLVRSEMLSHPQIQDLISEAGKWPGYPLKRHNDARHPIYTISTLADFGIRKDDPGMSEAVASIMDHQSPEGAFQIIINIPTVFGGTGEDQWSWISCDAPTSLYSLLALGCGSDPRVQKSVLHLISLSEENGYRCKASPDLGKFKGPGKRLDACPIANVYALKALSLVPEYLDSAATRAAANALLDHWEHRGEYKLFLFGIGTDFRKIKYPYIWYDILHITEVLSRFPFLHNDPRFLEMVTDLLGYAGSDGGFTANSMYRAWKGWSFADKKNPSPWLTFLVLRIQKRMENPN